MKAPLGTRTSLKLIFALLASLFVFSFSLPLFAASDNCLDVNGIKDRQTSSLVTASYSSQVDPLTGVVTFTYTFSGSDPANPPVDGVPGLITYCVYPDKGFVPDGAITALALGANGDPFAAKLSAKGSFSYTRSDGNPSNVPFDGNSYTMGTAVWASGCVSDGQGGLICQAPQTQTILLHINDASECQALYGGTSDTCWVFPGNGNTPPPSDCNGEPACKTANIDQATGDFVDCVVNGVDYGPCPVVPLKTLLNIHYTYEIVNQPLNAYNMIFYPPTNKTQDINSGGGKDYFGCEQIPDPLGKPGAWGTYNPYESTGFKFTFFSSTGTCSQSRFQMVAPGPSPIVLAPGQSVTFTVDMITRNNKGGKQEYTSCGPHLLNSGFTVKWFQDNDKLLHSFTTGITPLYVYAKCN
jgi:hypothetical protein